MLQHLRSTAAVACAGAVVGLTASCGAAGTGAGTAAGGPSTAAEESGAAASSAPSTGGFLTPAVESGFATAPPPDGGGGAGGGTGGGTGGAGGSGGGQEGGRVIVVSGPTLENRYPEVWEVFSEEDEAHCSAVFVASDDGVGADVPVRVALVRLVDEVPPGRFELFEPTDGCPGLENALTPEERDVVPCAGALLPPRGTGPVGCLLGVRFVGEAGTDSTARVQLTLEADCPSRSGTPCAQVPESEAPTADAPLRIRWTAPLGGRLLACLATGSTDSSELDGADACPTPASPTPEPVDPPTSTPATEVTEPVETPPSGTTPDAEVEVPPTATEPAT